MVLWAWLNVLVVPAYLSRERCYSVEKLGQENTQRITRSLVATVIMIERVSEGSYFWPRENGLERSRVSAGKYDIGHMSSYCRNHSGIYF